MQRPKKNIDRVSIERSNENAKEVIDNITQRAENLKNDPDCEQRLKEHLCKACFYVRKGGMAGTAFTDRPCGICDKVMTFSSTATDAICPSCAEDNGLCKKCGADMELKNRRKPYPFESNTASNGQ